jgi:hypothetical protein
MRNHAVPWLALLLLGAAHGLNPAMGWLFAVARGLHERDRRAVYRALGPLAAGHALAITVAVFTVLTVGQMLPSHWLRWGVAAALVGLGVDGLVRHRHVSLGGMRVTGRELATWSFLVASIHGAGLMVLPFVLGSDAAAANALHHRHDRTVVVAGLTNMDSLGIVAPLVHTLGYVAMTAILAAVVYEKLGLRILRRAWINLNALWAVALIATGGLALLL